MNKFKPHLLVLPEDDANRQIAVGFLLEPALRLRSIQILPPARGWLAARDRLLALLPEMARYPGRILVLLVDFDGRPDRAGEVMAGVPEDLRARIFVLGASSEPERLRQDLGSFESIGRALARDCVAGTTSAWAHPMLAHNVDEATRLMARARDVLFEGSAASS
jgi:hypothetical protein